MKRLIPLFFVAFLCACNSNTPEDPATKNQPKDPATWSPVGHKYVSTDDDIVYGHYGTQIIFISRDSFFWDRSNIESIMYYRLEYPIIYIGEKRSPWFKFVDTLTITKVSPLADESSCYELVY